MAPAAKQTKGKQSTTLRMFFDGKSPAGRVMAVSTPSSSLGSQKEKVPPTIEISDDESVELQPKNLTSSHHGAANGTEIRNQSGSIKQKQSGTKRRKITTLVSSDEDEETEKSPPKKRVAVASSSTVKAKPMPKPRESSRAIKPKVLDDDDFDEEPSSGDVPSEDDAYEDGEDVKPAKKRKSPSGKTTSKRLQSKTNAGDKTAETKKAQTEDSKPGGKYNWAAAKAAKMSGPVAHGSKEVPEGAHPSSLAGLSFVFTGELSSFSRDEAIDLAKRFGGRVVGQPSSKTDFIILGENAGPSKMAAIEKLQLKTLDEDGFLNLIATRKGLGDGKIDQKTRKKLEKEQEEIKKVAKDMEKREKSEKSSSSKSIDPSTQLWTSRYAPQSLKEICGNKGQVEKLQLWLHDWATSLKSSFKKPGKNGMNVYRAVLITGSPGIGKTTSAHLCAKLEGFTPIELNASDARSKKLVENGMNINNTSLDGYIKGNSSTNSVGVEITDKTCLIMDEVDGMSAGDRGGVGALNAMIKKTKIPIICIANDRGAQKLKPLMSTTFSLPFHKPQVNAIRSRILSIAFKEQLKIPANVIDQLITGAQSDIRQVLNMMSTWKLSNTSMNFDEGKNLAKMNEKYAILTPFDITSKMLGPYLFSPTSRETLGDKMEYYFQDHSFVPLFIQENYLKTEPAKLRNLEGPDKILRQLEIMDRAASSISDGDMVDALIHGPEQHWSLMPLHAVCSTVRPASFQYGMGAHYGGANAMIFPQWLGQNSKKNKLMRQLNDVQVRMRLKVSADKLEIRQSYIPALFPYIVNPLMEEGSNAIGEVIGRMDEYYLSKEDWDTIVELGVGDKKDEFVNKKISGATKSALTRKYNASEHPIPFHKAQDLGKLSKKLAGGPAPDLEEAFIDDITEDVSEDESKKKDPDDISGDKLIQVSKKKKTAGKAKK